MKKKHYVEVIWYPTKYMANQLAKGLRKSGHFVKVVKNKGKYVVYAKDKD